MEDVAHGLKSQNFFPTVGANGPCTVHVNFGQMGFVFIEANVKKWGLAPMTGSLAPPPPYGSEQGSILLEAGREGAIASPRHDPSHHARSRSGIARIGFPTSPGPQRSPTDISLSHLTHIPTNENLPSDSGIGIGIATSSTVTNPPQHDPGPPDVQNPPDYASADGSISSDEDDTAARPRVRGPGQVAKRDPPPPIPTYDAAVGNFADDLDEADEDEDEPERAGR